MAASSLATLLRRQRTLQSERNTCSRCTRAEYESGIRGQWNTQGKGTVFATKAAQTQGKGMAFATKAAETQGKGSVFATKAVETRSEGGVLAMKAVETQSEGGVSPAART